MTTMDLHTESQTAWETNAQFWDESIGPDGNMYWKRLQEPALARMLPATHKRPDTRALDLGTGNGLTARWLHSQGCGSVVATDFSAEMIRIAERRHRSADDAGISYRQLDVTDATSLEALGGETPGGFHVILMNMAIMDVANIEPLAKALPKLLAPDGVFLASVLHPVFFTSGATRTIEILNGSGTTGPEIVRGKTVRNYLDVPPNRGVAMYNQPVQQIYFHRPIHELFSIFFRAGLVMDAIEEPAFTHEDRAEGQIEAHWNFTQLPAVLAFRLRKL